MKSIIEFIDARLPGFASAIRGASTEAIAQLQARTSKPLPRLYVDFLSTMGEDSSAFPAFPRYLWSAPALLDCWPGDEFVSYDRDRYFKIAINASEEGASYADYFLDLGRSDGEDALMVAFEDPSEEGIPGDLVPTVPDASAELHQTLRAWLCHRAFHFFELMRRPELADCGFYTDLIHPETTWQEVRRALDRLGLPQPFDAPNSWFGVSKDVCAQGMLLGASASVRIGASSRRELLKITELLRDHVDVIDVEEIPRQGSPTSL